ncbi:MAG TPA: hypothetical protein PK649_04285 [Vicingus sp.]|nr:hypothetical protein [Vicingus sp.]
MFLNIIHTAKPTKSLTAVEREREFFTNKNSSFTYFLFSSPLRGDREGQQKGGAYD